MSFNEPNNGRFPIQSTLRYEIYNEIKNQILHGSMKNGERIREDIIAEQMGVSRTPVREAVAQLESEGFVKIIPRRGVFVAEILGKKMWDVLEVRKALEGLAVKKAVALATETDIGLLEDIYKKQIQCFNAEDYDECLSLDRSFHDTLARISQNEKLIGFMENIGDLVQMARVINCLDPISIEESLVDHREILDAVKARNCEDAVTAMARHLNNITLAQKECF